MTVSLSPQVANAQKAGRPVVALESSVIAQGLPKPANGEAVHRMCAALYAQGCEPAVTAVVRGALTMGLDEAELEHFINADGIPKLSARDIPVAIARGLTGATTVAASLACCVAAGVEVFATGGIGGVHFDPPFDESADLVELSRSPVITVCAGAKSILNLPATLERLETLGVTVVGFGTDEFPGFFSVRTGLKVPARVDSAAEAVAVFRAMRQIGRPGGLLVVQPPPLSVALSRVEVDEAVEKALNKARAEGVSGAKLTPALLAGVEEATEGRSLRANVALLESNATLAGKIARELVAGVGTGTTINGDV